MLKHKCFGTANVSKAMGEMREQKTGCTVVEWASQVIWKERRAPGEEINNGCDQEGGNEAMTGVMDRRVHIMCKTG